MPTPTISWLDINDSNTYSYFYQIGKYINHNLYVQLVLFESTLAFFYNG